MAPKKSTHANPTPRKRKTRASSSHHSQIDEDIEDGFRGEKFKTKKAFDRFLVIETSKLIAERKVDLKPGDRNGDEFIAELERRNWLKLANPPEKISAQIVREFYANASSGDSSQIERETWVRGKTVLFDRDTINMYLGDPLPSYSENQLDGYNRYLKSNRFDKDDVARDLCIAGQTYQDEPGKPKSFLRPSLKTLTQIWLIFLCSNVYPTIHTSDLKLQKSYLVWSIMVKHLEVDIAQIISDKILSAVKAENPRVLPYPALITGLCEFQRVQIPAHPISVLNPPINASYIKKNCVNPLENMQGPVNRPRPPLPEPNPQEQQYQMLMNMLNEQRQMMIANQATQQRCDQKLDATYRALSSLNDSFYRFSLQHGGENSFGWPTPAQFAAHVAWPEDGPMSQEGKEATHDGVDTHVQGDTGDARGTEVEDDFMDARGEEAEDDFME